MAQKQLRGVGGVLNNLISAPEPSLLPPLASTPQESQVAAPREQPPEPEEPRPATTPEPTAEKATRPRKKAAARRGRPPTGSRSSEPAEREKVSLRLRADLAATYRDWSWEEHCQFSDLVDRALEFYLKSRGKARKPESE